MGISKTRHSGHMLGFFLQDLLQKCTQKLTSYTTTHAQQTHTLYLIHYNCHTEWSCEGQMNNRWLCDSRGHCCCADFELPGHLQVFLAQHKQEQNKQADEQDAEDSQSRDGSNAWIHLFGCRYTDRRTDRRCYLSAQSSPISSVFSTQNPSCMVLSH